VEELHRRASVNPLKMGEWVEKNGSFTNRPAVRASDGDELRRGGPCWPAGERVALVGRVRLRYGRKGQYQGDSLRRQEELWLPSARWLGPGAVAPGPAVREVGCRSTGAVAGPRGKVGLPMRLRPGKGSECERFEECTF